MTKNETDDFRACPDPAPVMVEVCSPDPTGHGGDADRWRGRIGVICGLNGQFVTVVFEDGTRAAFDPLELRECR